MKTLLAGLAALALAGSAGHAMAQNTDTQAQADTATATGPGSGTTPGSYSGVDTDGRREHVQAPYGGNSQAQADAKEAPITDQLNQQALQAASPQH